MSASVCAAFTWNRIVSSPFGTTGNVTGPHLHLEVHPHGGDPVDPFGWLRRHGLRP